MAFTLFRLPCVSNDACLITAPKSWDNGFVINGDDYIFDGTIRLGNLTFWFLWDIVQQSGDACTIIRFNRLSAFKAT